MDTDGFSGAVDQPSLLDGGTDALLDSAAPADASIAPVPCGQTATTATCRMFGVCCPAEAPYCRVALDLHARTSVISCSESEDTRRAGDPCAPDAGQCGDGLSCTLTYPSATTPYKCSPLCRSVDDCGDGGLFCNHLVSATDPVRQCSQCDAVTLGNDCPADAPICTPGTTSGPPRCISSYTGTKNLGGACVNEHDCELGLVCQCGGADGGALLLGGDCDPGTCRAPCYPYDEGKPCGGGTCTVIAGTNYALCLP